MSYRRRRTPLACTLCRKRKRKCDAQRPRCGTCQEMDAECVYDEMPLEIIQPHPEPDVQESLNRMESLIQANSMQVAALMEIVQQNNCISTSPNYQPSFPANTPLAADTSLSPNTFPSNASHRETTYPGTLPFVRTIQENETLPPLTIPEKHSTSSNHLLLNTTIREMIGQYPSDYFLRLESKNEVPIHLLSPEPNTADPILDRSTTDNLVTYFFANVHCYQPILNRPDFDEAYRRAIETGFSTSPETSLCFTVFALASFVQESSTESSFPGMSYMRRVLPELLVASTWNFIWDVKISQALILASVYFAYLARPLYSWRLINMAASHTHFLLPRLESMNGSTSTKEEISRCFWSCFMIECDRLAELEVPQSSLQKLVDHMPLPSFREGLDDLETTYYLAEISLRRLFNRIHNSIYPRIFDLNGEGIGIFENDQLSKLFAICDELHSQLDTWHSSIPDPFRPDVHDVRPPIHDRERVLGIRYFAALHIIYRPFVLHTVAFEKGKPLGHPDGPALSDTILNKCRICIESCRVYLHRATEMLKKPSPYTWTFSISSLGAVLVLTMAAHCSRLVHFVSDIDELQTLVIDHVEPWASVLKNDGVQQSESSLEAAVGILKEIRRKCRIRNFFD